MGSRKQRTIESSAGRDDGRHILDDSFVSEQVKAEALKVRAQSEQRENLMSPAKAAAQQPQLMSPWEKQKQFEQEVLRRLDGMYGQPDPADDIPEDSYEAFLADLGREIDQKLAGASAPQGEFVPVETVYFALCFFPNGLHPSQYNDFTDKLRAVAASQAF